MRSTNLSRPTGEYPNFGSLNMYPQQGDGLPGPNKDNSSRATAFYADYTTDTCAQTDNLLRAALAYKNTLNGTIPYSATGPNSNSAAHYVGILGGFDPTPPPGSFGWCTPIPGGPIPCSLPPPVN